jgi:hypothetical protein
MISRSPPHTTLAKSRHLLASSRLLIEKLDRRLGVAAGLLEVTERPRVAHAERRTSNAALGESDVRSPR